LPVVVLHYGFIVFLLPMPVDPPVNRIGHRSVREVECLNLG
jgi:hypothetical protein